MKSISLSLVILFLALSNAEAANEFRLGIVDFQRALNGVDEGKAATQKLEKEKKAKEEEFGQKAKKLEAMKKEIDDLRVKEQSGLLKGAEQNKLHALDENFQKQYKDFVVAGQKAEREGMEKERSATGKPNPTSP